MPTLSERLIAIKNTLLQAGVPHAFGGAIALAYYAEPRATRDLDINIFLTAESADIAIDVLANIIPISNKDYLLSRVRYEGQVRVTWEEVPVDLFFSNTDFHDACASRIRWVPFNINDTIPILSGEDLIVCKVAFNREKDWVDIREMLLMSSDSMDISYVNRWLEEFFPPSESRMEKWVSYTHEINLRERQ